MKTVGYIRRSFVDAHLDARFGRLHAKGVSESGSIGGDFLSISLRANLFRCDARTRDNFQEIVCAAKGGSGLGVCVCVACIREKNTETTCPEFIKKSKKNERRGKNTAAAAAVKLEYGDQNASAKETENKTTAEYLK